MKHILSIFSLLLITACAYRNPVSDMSFQATPAPPYVIANWYKIEAPTQPLKVYIEGDGHAFDAHGQPTDNPTPKGDFVRRLAADDPAPNVAYIARPCQFLQPACTQSDWTDGRFSDKVIRSLDTTIHSLMKKARTNKIVLVGFSGGAQIAGHLAVRHPDQVKHLITISGVLDHAAWTSYHHDSPLSKSLNLADYKKQFQALPQTHYVGDKDDIVPPSLVQAFATPDTVVVVHGATHDSGYKSIYDKIYEVH